MLKKTSYVTVRHFEFWWDFPRFYCLFTQVNHVISNCSMMQSSIVNLQVATCAQIVSIQAVISSQINNENIHTWEHVVKSLIKGWMLSVKSRH